MDLVSRMKDSICPELRLQSVPAHCYLVLPHTICRYPGKKKGNNAKKRKEKEIQIKDMFVYLYFRITHVDGKRA